MSLKIFNDKGEDNRIVKVDIYYTTCKAPL